MNWSPRVELYHPFLRTRIRRGRGVGKLEAFDPWLHVRDVPSEGTSLISRGIKVPRAHHLLSELEQIFFFLQERRHCVVDIREAWPILDIDGTLRICAELGVSHKYRGVYPEPFTLDFAITERHGEKLVHRAASVKPPGAEKDPDTRQRLAVEYRWCKGRSIPWTLVDTAKFSKEMLFTLRTLRGWFRVRFQPDGAKAVHFAENFMAQYQRNVPLIELIARAGSRTGVRSESAEDYFKYCGWTDSIKVALDAQLTLDAPLVLRDC